ncbi:hypothetical protein [Nocardioides panacisoli]|uniref:hypothetical protein n=1 Tax=Nocardioides panacisoli TaxID=627624 RepID=UPI0031D99B93
MPTTTRRRHLLTDVQLASHAGATAEDLTHGHRDGNGLRAHRTYIIVVSLVALVLLGVAIAAASGSM